MTYTRELTENYRNVLKEYANGIKDENERLRILNQLEQPLAVIKLDEIADVIDELLNNQ